MKYSLGIFSVLVMGLTITTETSWADPSTPKQQYSAILKEYNQPSAGMRKATTDLERIAAVKRIATFSSRFVEIAEKYPNHPIALTALRQAVQVVGTTDSAAQVTWETNRSEFSHGVTDGSAGKTVALVLRDHLPSKKLGPVIDRMRYCYRLEYEKCLMTVLEKNSHRNVQGLACLALAQYLNDKLRMLQLAEDRPELAECYNIVFGDDYYPQLKRLGQADLAARIEALFERAANEYSDVKFRNGTVGETAKSELNDIRVLGVGRVAPDIEGKDQDATQFKLSDYRGQVVLLYFWSEYCLTCRTTWPHERSLVTTLKDKPFALIGVNSWPHNQSKLKDVMTKENINWRTFDLDGSINSQWDLSSTPMFYIIDHKGTIRHKWVGKPGKKSIDAALAKLIQEAEEYNIRK